jgi:diguanylate cyclase (GGDEF)-like protein/PAS domain S-box-containing protein
MWLVGRDPFPGPSDIFYCSYFVALTAACIFMIQSLAVRVRWLQLALDATIFMVGFGAFFWYLVIRPAALATSVNSLAQFLAQFCAALGCAMLLLLGVVVLAASTAGKTARRISLYTLTGFATLFVADILWALAKVKGYYLPGQFQDVLYMIYYVPLAAAGYEQWRSGATPPRRQIASADTLSRIIPYASMLAAFVALVYFSHGDGLSPASVMTMVVFGLTLLIMVRQALVWRSDALYREQRAAQRVEQRYASLIANAHDVIMIVDSSGILRFVSPSSEGLLGLRPGDMTGRALTDVWTGESAATLNNFLAEVAAIPSGTVGPIELQYARDAKSRTIECVGSNLTQDAAVAGYALNLRDISERKALEEQLRHLAFHDPLGHDAGDRLLQAVSGRLAKATRSADTVARLGGDEFAVLLEGCAPAAQVALLADKLIEVLSAPIELGGTEVPVGVSIGIAWFDQETDAELLLSNADVAMYHAKSAGKGCHSTYAPAMRDAFRDRLRLEGDIDRALANHEFFIEYQPIVDLGSRSLLGVEALVRWNHPLFGLLMPGQFIQVIEERGQIATLGRWVLQQAAREFCRWRPVIAGGSELRLAVNISGRHLLHGTLAEDVRMVLRQSGLEARNLVIELTESTIMQRTESTFERFRELEALGVRLAIDDFGVGYSSLSYLHRFPIDILKIDRSFISQLVDSEKGSELARAVITLGESLELDTVAEGIETESQISASQPVSLSHAARSYGLHGGNSKPCRPPVASWH